HRPGPDPIGNDAAGRLQPGVQAMRTSTKRTQLRARAKLGVVASDMERRDDGLDVRVSDAERERVVELLKGHLADGRVSMDEFSDRAAEAYASKTVRDLERCLRDLPPSRRAAAREDRRGRREW